MNVVEKMHREDRLRSNIASWMAAHGRVLSDRQSSNFYAGIRVREIEWRGSTYRVVDVDGLTCLIERQ